VNPQHEIYELQCKAIGDMAKENNELKQRIKRLNEKINSLIKAGNELRECASRIGTVAAGEASVIRRTQEAIEEWNNKTK